MRNWIALVALGFLMVVSSAASAADWTGSADGSDTVTRVKPPAIVYLATGGETSSVLNIRECSRFSIVVYGTGASVMPVTCRTSACTESEDLLDAALTGDTTNRFMGSVVPFELIRLVTTSSVNVALKCGN